MNVNQNLESILVIGDEGCDRDKFYQYLELEKPSENNSTDIHFVKRPLGCRLRTLEIYILPDDRLIKPYCNIYLEIITPPNLIIYFIQSSSKIKQFTEWIQMLQNHGFGNSKMVFISMARTYSQRLQIISKLSPFFTQDIVNHIYFIVIDQKSFLTCLSNLDSIGITLESYVKNVSRFDQIKWGIKNMIKRFKKQKNSVI